MAEALRSGETLDVLCHDRLQIIQRKKGYRFSVDAILLANAVRLRKGERLLDIGTGCGIIPIYLSRKGAANLMTGIEIQEDLYDLAVRNRELNGCTNIRFMQGDMRTRVQELQRTPFHVVVSNPPYTRALAGRASPDPSRHTARHDTLLDLDTLLEVSARVLYTKGRLYTIYPAGRTGELVSTAAAKGLELKRLRSVHPRPEEEANLILTEFVKGARAGTRVERPLYVFGENGNTEEVKEYYEIAP